MNKPTLHGPVSIGRDVEFGTDCIVWQFATICDGAKLGNGVVVGSGAWVGKSIILGDGVRIQHGAFLPNGTVVGKNVFIGPNATLTDDKYPKAGQSYDPQPPILEDECSLGAGCVVLPGVRIGRGALVGAGSVVVQDLPPGVTCIGVPARILAHKPEEGV